MVKMIPEGWLNYNNWGTIVADTKFFPFKVPLKETTMVPSGMKHTTRAFIADNPNVKLIINLTDTKNGKYYNYDDFISKGISIFPIRVRGGGKLPGKNLLNRFAVVVQDFMCTTAKSNPNALIGVHCTHGLNRTGYFICKYMIGYMGAKPEMAVEQFEKARGYKIDRSNFVTDILTSKI